ncbi:hypothetical protein Ahy_B02g060547 [Arachis hypogaea]|uniref:Protein FAR1-RELATED SEQUENCE n=1 Tax=Arachis hypogaea TaxID=3818 RepID=A0A445AIQ2_ARAHY|nr:hypothetical protein Ahy_B02g060547 [Arachis hypogaea]
MNESTSNQLNECDLDNSSETYQFDEISYVVDEKFVPKVGMIFKTLEEAGKFYKQYSKLASFSTKIRNTTQNGDKIKNKLIVCSRERRWKSKIYPTLKTNPSAGLNCPARIYVHIMKDVGLWTIFKVVLNHSYPCCPDQAEMLKQHRELSIAVRGSPYMDFGLLGSPLLCRDEKHIKEREYAFIFQQQYDNCQASRDQAEREFDAANFHTVIPCATKSAIKAQFQHVYTHEKFKEVQAQFRGKVNCITRSMHSTLGFTTYEVSNSTFNKFVVTCDAVSRDVKCHCLLFESKGILYCRFLSVLSFERVDNVAPKYILERWSKNIKRRHTHIKSSQDEPLLEPRSKKFDELVFRSHNICEFAYESEELTGIFHRAFDKVMAEMEEYQGRSKGKSLLTHEEATLSNVNDLQSLPRVKTRGRPKNRLGSNLEKKISNAMKKKKKTAPSEEKLTCF